MQENTQRELTDLLSDPRSIANTLASFRESAKVLSSAREDLIGKYGQRWVALRDGKVIAECR